MIEQVTFLNHSINKGVGKESGKPYVMVKGTGVYKDAFGISQSAEFVFFEKKSKPGQYDSLEDGVVYDVHFVLSKDKRGQALAVISEVIKA